ncbi:LuxR C-terminal-related transcriptional regulator [Thermasporomyces composti]|uniref:LuxR family maltose regulon positive regulatory protein n=1 Tax=Thermasporomyces composti TaxID=696763 RepID=A0A3D9VBC6_THECX|nr:LuxR C-terminal-related transcriptional regulator [Thermasporomyces composti]REF35454.1 LuxR family maltose regulon positive regulatory protein [Thermasporomyces composti]
MVRESGVRESGVRESGVRESGAHEVTSGRLVPRARSPFASAQLDAASLGPDVPDTKVTVPAPSVPILPRPRLFQALERACERRVTAVNASAGAGKTLLLASWLSWSAERRAAWVSFDPGDDTPKVFWACVVKALRRACGAESHQIDRLLDADTDDERFPARLLDAAAAFTTPVVLVIDEAHRIGHSRVLAGLDVVARHAPATLRLVLSGRGLPRLSLARLRVTGDLADIGPKDLACTTAEAQEFFRLVGVELDAEDVATVLERTEGWMAGLRLAALWRQTQPPWRREFASFTGAEPMVAEYLDEEVLAPQPAKVRRFLLRTSVVDRVNGDLADALTGDDDGRQTLESLERENALVHAGPDRTWYQYSPLLREFLLHRLRRDHPDEVTSLHRSAARWFAANGHVVEAERHAQAAGDWALAGSLLAQDGYRVIANGEGASLIAMLSAIPTEAARSDTNLALVSAHARLSDNDADGADGFLRAVEAKETGADASGATFSGARSSLLTERLATVELRLHQCCLRGQIDGGVVRAAYQLREEARRGGLGGIQAPRLSTLTYWLGMAELWRGRLLAAREAFAEALPGLVDAGFTLWARRARVWHVFVDAVDGRLTAAERGLASLSASSSHETPDPAVDLARAHICLARDRLDQAWAIVGARRVAHLHDDQHADPAAPPLEETLGLLRARVRFYQGDVAAAKAELAAAAAAPSRLRDHIERSAALLEAEIALHEGGTARAWEILSSRAAPTVAADAVLAGRLHLADGEPAAALEAVSACVAGTALQTRLLDTVAGLLVAACAHRRLGSQAAAASHLERALALAEADGLIRVFLDAGRGIRALLTVAIAPDGPHASFRGTLLHRFDIQPTATWKTPEQRTKLTRSERAVLRYLPSHLTNEEIAQDLCLSVNTVKSHLRTLYRKLGVTSRREAIARAMQLELLR